MLPNLQLNNILQVFTISKIDDSTYTISINFTSNINQGDLLIIEFPAPLISNLNSLLLTDKLSIHLFAADINNLVSQINQLKTKEHKHIFICKHRIKLLKDEMEK